MLDDIENKISSEYRVGHSCFYMNVSAVLEYYDSLTLSMIYTLNDFIYSPGYFSQLDNVDSQTNFGMNEKELNIAEGISSCYANDFIDYVYEREVKSKVYKLTSMKTSGLNKIEQIENKLKEISPLIFSADYYYLHDEYKSQNNALKSHSYNHKALVLNIGENCSVVDKFYSFVGTISKDSLSKALESEYVIKEKREVVSVTEIAYLGLEEREKINFILKEQDAFLRDRTFIVNGRKYYRNTEALKMFIADLPIIIDDLIKKYDEFAPQILERILTPVILQRISLNNLFKYFTEIKNLEEFEILESVSKKCMQEWMKVNFLCDKCYLKGYSLDKYTDRFIKVVNNILEYETILSEELRAITF